MAHAFKEQVKSRKKGTCNQFFGANEGMNCLDVLDTLLYKLPRLQCRFINKQKRALGNTCSAKQKFASSVIFFGTYQSLESFSAVQQKHFSHFLTHIIMKRVHATHIL
jgi:hypothetical protein